MFSQGGSEDFPQLRVFDDVAEGFHGDGDVLAVPFIATVFEDIAECAEGLHEPLGGALVEEGWLWALV